MLFRPLRACLFLSLLLYLACVTAPTHSHADLAAAAGPADTRGRLLQYHSLGVYSKKLLKLGLSQAGLSQLPVRYPVRLYQVIYRTVFPDGQLGKASGLL